MVHKFSSIHPLLLMTEGRELAEQLKESEELQISVTFSLGAMGVCCKYTGCPKKKYPDLVDPSDKNIA